MTIIKSFQISLEQAVWFP